MNELIELLNEYDEGGNWRKIHWKGLGCEDYDAIGYKDKELTCEQDEIISYLISKPYGFIKWLVDNDKIDLDKLKDNTSFTMLTHSIGLGCEWHTAHEGESILRVIGTNAIIAYLSIQDEPIEFLISILK